MRRDDGVIKACVAGKRATKDIKGASYVLQIDRGTKACYYRLKKAL